MTTTKLSLFSLVLLIAPASAAAETDIEDIFQPPPALTASEIRHSYGKLLDDTVINDGTVDRSPAGSTQGCDGLKSMPEFKNFDMEMDAPPVKSDYKR